ncbi:MAG: hypothetical protein GC131_04445 [Alphaproteobacteria bacterium]|nr:hypothetical protein [Alphaproteobacteria bacterium]
MQQSPHYARLLELADKYLNKGDRGVEGRAAAQPSGRKLNEVEITSICALVAYAAANTDLPESMVTDRLCALFNATKIEEVDARQYDTAIAFLVDFTGRLN